MSFFFSNGYYQRFSGIARLYGQQALCCFSQAHICVIGLGGVGSWAAEALARTGIGAITLIDMDEVCVTNTNRQLVALRSRVGQAKTRVMAERILEINPECQVNCIDDFIMPNNVSQLIDSRFNYVIDAIDSVMAKAALLAYCRQSKIPLITIGGAGGQRDPTRIMVADLAKTIEDPLAAKVREYLKRDFKLVKNSRGRLGIDCVFSTESLVYPQIDGRVCASKGEVAGSMRMDCASGFGAVTMVTASFGFVAVAHLLKKMLAKLQHRSVEQSV